MQPLYNVNHVITCNNTTSTCESHASLTVLVKNNFSSLIKAIFHRISLFRSILQTCAFWVLILMARVPISQKIGSSSGPHFEEKKKWALGHSGIVTCPNCNWTNPSCNWTYTRALLQIGFLSRIRAFWGFLSRLLLRHLGFDSDFAQISEQKIGGWGLWGGPQAGWDKIPCFAKNPGWKLTERSLIRSA